METVEVTSELRTSLDKAKIGMLVQKGSTFVSTVLFSLKLKWTRSLPTAGVDGKYLYLNPDFWLAQSPNVRVSILFHETWHVCFNHMFRRNNMDKKKWNYAGDYVINLMGRDAEYEIPSEWLISEDYRGLSTKEVYDLLPEPEGDSGGLGDDLIESAGGDSEIIEQEVADVLIRAATRAKLDEASGNAAGYIPGEIEIMIEELINPKLDWRTILQNYMSSFTKDDYTFQRPNKRFQPDYYLASLRSESVGEIAIAVDTSGSVSDDEFKIFLTEINDIKEKMNPSLTTIIDFDTKINHVHSLTQDQSVKSLPFSGRGGTNLKPVFEHYNKHKPVVLIIFSDLECWEIEDDPGYPVIWICVNNPNASVNFGELIHYET